MGSRFYIVPVLFAGLCLFGRTAFADVTATQPTAQVKGKQPTTLAEIVTFSVQGDQLVSQLHWKPAGGQASLTLADVPGETRVNALGPTPFDPPGESLDIDIIRNFRKKDGYLIRLWTSPGPLGGHIVYDCWRENEPSCVEHLQLSFGQNGCTLMAQFKGTSGQPAGIINITEPSWADLLAKHPEAVYEDVLPLLEILHLESLLTPPDLWAYQVLADWLMPSPEMDMQVKELLDQLDDLSAEKCAEATEKLKKLGNQALPVFVRMDRRRFTPAQATHFRLFAQGFLNDNRIQVLKTDKKFLLDCLQSRDEAVRRAAAAQLQAVVGQPIDYDPAGTPAGRGVQTHRLRQLLIATTQPSTQP